MRISDWSSDVCSSDLLLQQRREQRVVDQRSGEADALVEADEVGAGVGVDAASLRFEGRAQEGAGRSLAVGAGDVEGTGELELRIAEPRAQLGDTLEPQNVAPRRQRGETIELGMDGGVVGVGVGGAGQGYI